MTPLDPTQIPLRNPSRTLCVYDTWWVPNTIDLIAHTR
ncbi:unnamed protein product [Prunus brigantina]